MSATAAEFARVRLDNLKQCAHQQDPITLDALSSVSENRLARVELGQTGVSQCYLRPSLKRQFLEAECEAKLEYLLSRQQTPSVEQVQRKFLESTTRRRFSPESIDEIRGFRLDDEDEQKQ